MFGSKPGAYGAGLQALWNLPLDGGEPARVRDEFVLGYEVSPDGTRVAFGVTAPAGVANQVIWQRGLKVFLGGSG